MVPALPLIPGAALSPPSAGMSAPGRQSVVEAAMNAATTTREGAREPAAEVTSSGGVAPDRNRETAPRAIEPAPVAAGPRVRTSAEPMHPVTGAASGPAFRPDGNPAPFVPMPAAAASLMNMAEEDPSLHAAALGKSAHIRLDAGTDGELALHMVVKDGVVDMRVDGAAARTLDIRPDEVRTALAGEGIPLGRFETGNAGSFSGSPGGYRDGAADQGGQGGQNAGGQPTSSARHEPSFADTAAAQTGGGQTPAQGGFGGGGRHFDAQDRWTGRDSATTARPPAPGASSSSLASSSSSADEATNSRPRRRYHVTA